MADSILQPVKHLSLIADLKCLLPCFTWVFQDEANIDNDVYEILILQNTKDLMKEPSKKKKKKPTHTIKQNKKRHQQVELLKRSFL